MTQYDAGPGEWSERPWDDPDRKPKRQAQRRRVTLPTWALLAILVAVVIGLCVGLVLIVKAIRGDGDRETATPTATVEVTPTATLSLVRPTLVVTGTSTVVLPVGSPAVTAPPTTIGPGVMVVVTGTGAGGLNLREQPTTYAKKIGTAREGTVLIVLEGPRDSDGYVWWKLRSPDGLEGWAAANWLVLKPAE